MLVDCDSAVSICSDISVRILLSKILEVIYKIVSDVFWSINPAYGVGQTISSGIHKVVYSCDCVCLVVVNGFSFKCDILDFSIADDKSYALMPPEL